MVILSLFNSEKHILQEIMQISKKYPNFQIRDKFLHDEILDYGELKINLLKRNAEKNGQEIELTMYEFDTLYLLAKHPGWVFSRENIYKLIWKEPYNFAECSVIHTISNLRKKIETDRKHPTYILTIRGVGYKFNQAYHNVG